MLFGATYGLVWIKSSRFAILTALYFMGGALLLPLLAMVLILLAGLLGIATSIEVTHVGILIYSILGGILGVLLHLGIQGRTSPREATE